MTSADGTHHQASSRPEGGRIEGRIEARGDVTLEPVSTGDIATLEHLFQLYVHDFTDFVPVAMGADGLFRVPIDAAWWTAPDHHPFLVHWRDSLAGFALVRRGSRVTHDTEPMDVAEMFVLRGLRKRGVGAHAARGLFAAFPGKWEVRVHIANAPASRFWSRLIEAYVGSAVVPERFTSGGAEREVYRFVAASPASVDRT